MLESLEGTKITSIAHLKNYNLWCSRITANEYQKIEDDLNNKINAADIHTAGWMPGKIWEGTVFEPILNKACKGNQTQAGLFFGIIVFKVFMDRPEKWICGRFEKDGKDIGSITYFRPTKP